MSNKVCVILNYCDSKKCSDLVAKNLEDDFFDYTVIVDNNSPDNSREVLEPLAGDKVIFLETNENRGFAAGNNYGIRYALNNLDPKYILCMGADIIVERDALDKCYSIMESHNDIACISPIMLDWKKNVDKDFAWKMQTFKECLNFTIHLTRRKGKFKTYVPTDDTKEFVYADVVRGSFMFFRADVLEKIDMFDEKTFLFYEENIICKKISDAGYKVAFVPNATYIHNHVLVDTRSKIKYKASLKSAYYYLVKYQHINIFKRLTYKMFCMLGRIEYGIGSIFKKRRKG